MSFSEVRPMIAQPSLSKNVVDVLREMIASGELAPGQHLKESEIALTLGVSRGPVREAFVSLANEGYVEVRRYRGAFVSELTRRDITEVYSLRLALERLAVERASTRVTAEQLEAMDRIIEKMRHVKRDYTPQEAVELDLSFHDIVYQAADHQRLDRSWQYIRSQVAFFLRARNSSNRDFLAVGYEEHKAIRDILAAHDTASAVSIIEEHLNGAYRRLLTARGGDEGAVEDLA